MSPTHTKLLGADLTHNGWITHTSMIPSPGATAPLRGGWWVGGGGPQINLTEGQGFTLHPTYTIGFKGVA